MATEKQLAAKRRNALLTAGPRSVEGKAAASGSALKTGLYWNGIIVGKEDPGKLAALEAAFTAEYAPATPTERSLVARNPGPATPSWTSPPSPASTASATRPNACSTRPSPNAALFGPSAKLLKTQPLTPRLASFRQTRKNQQTPIRAGAKRRPGPQPPVPSPQPPC
jgi:hypothetical protein